MLTHSFCNINKKITNGNSLLKKNIVFIQISELEVKKVHFVRQSTLTFVRREGLVRDLL